MLWFLPVWFVGGILVGLPSATMDAECGVHGTAQQDLWRLRQDMMCGPHCLWQASYLFGRRYSLRAVTYMTGVRPDRGATIMGMVTAARDMGLRAQPIKTNIKELGRERGLAILLLNLEKEPHYVLLDAITEDEVRVIEADSLRTLTLEQFASAWSGYAIIVQDACEPAPHILNGHHNWPMCSAPSC